jgi:hypothetical protein
MMNDNDQVEDRQRQLLVEDGAQADEAQAVVSVMEALRTADVALDAAARAALLTRLLPEMPPRRLTHRERLVQWWPLLLMRSQMRVVRHEIWSASVLMLALGVMVTLAVGATDGKVLLPFTVLAPVVAAVGVALLYDSDMEAVLELEAATPASARLLLLTRLALVFGFDLVLALAASVLLAVLDAQILLWPLVESWLAPMAFLSALAFALTIILGESLVGIFAGLVIWGLHVVTYNLRDAPPLLYLLSLPGLSSAEFRPALLLAGVLLVGLALWSFDLRSNRGGINT